MHRTGFTGLICSSPRRDKPAIPNRVWKGSTCRGQSDSVIFMSQQRQATNKTTHLRVEICACRGHCRCLEENVSHHVSWSIGEASRLLVLTGQNEPPQLGFVNPVDPADDLQRRQDPPRVAHIWKLSQTGV